MILVQVPRGMARQVEVPDDVTDRSCKGTLHLRTGTKCLTEAEWKYLEAKEKKIAKKLRVIKRDVLSRDEAKVKHATSERKSALEKQSSMPATKFEGVDKQALSTSAPGKPPQKPQAGHRLSKDGATVKPSKEAVEAAETGKTLKQPGASSEPKTEAKASKTKPKLKD